MAENAIEKFVEYLKIQTVHPNPDYSEAVKFLVQYAEDLDLISQITECHPGKPIVIISWVGSEPKLGSIMLNSHIDVVPVETDKWTHPPFEARRVDGNIFARGTQDVKGLGMMYLEAIRLLKASKFSPKRTVHVSFVPDEEIGGFLGMALFAKTEEFKQLNVELVLDEGIPSPSNEIPVFYAERSAWWVEFTFHGVPGHGLLLKEDTAAEKLHRFTSKVFEFRKSQQLSLKMAKNDSSTLVRHGQVISCNWNMMEGGVQANIIPGSVKATFDFRIPPSIDLQVFEEQLKTWCREACLESNGQIDAFEIKFIKKGSKQPITDVNNERIGKFWASIKLALETCGLTSTLAIFPGTTDCRYLREMDIASFNISVIPNTPILLHDNDEFIAETTFVKGIETYRQIIENLSLQ